MESSKETDSYCSIRNVEGGRNFEVEGFLLEILEKVCLEIDIVGIKQRPNLRPQGEDNVKSRKAKQVHFSSPLITEAYSQLEDEDTQDTVILCSENGNGEFEMTESEDEMRRQFVEEGGSFVPEFHFCPVDTRKEFEFDDIFFGKFASQEVRPEIQIKTEKVEGSLNLKTAEKDCKISMEEARFQIGVSNVDTEESIEQVKRSQLLSEKSEMEVIKSVVQSVESRLQSKNDESRIQLDSSMRNDWLSERETNKEKKEDLKENINIEPIRNEILEEMWSKESCKIYNENRGKNDLKWQTEIIKKKYCQNDCFSVDKLKEDMGRTDKKSKVENVIEVSCRSEMHFMHLEVYTALILVYKT